MCHGGTARIVEGEGPAAVFPCPVGAAPVHKTKGPLTRAPQPGIGASGNGYALVAGLTGVAASRIVRNCHNVPKTPDFPLADMTLSRAA